MTKYRALVVEDDSSWQQILSEILSDSNLEVDITSSVEEAIHALKQHAHRVAVVDLSLAPNDHNNVDGLRVLDAVRKQDPNCKAILLTGFATVEVAVTALTDYGAFNFLRKENFNRAQFRDTISRILASAPSDSVSAKESAPQKNLSASPKESSERALVVEDDAGWRSILEELLSDAGFNVRTCASFGDALGYLRREKFSLVVIDLALNGIATNARDESPAEEMSGYQLLASSYLNNVPAIVVSGLDDPDEIQKIYSEYPVSAYVQKQTFDRAAFRRTVKEARVSHPVLSQLNALTEREREVLDLLAQGLTNKEIAEQLVITPNTVKRHLKAIFEKLDVHTRSAATAKVAGGN